MYRDFGGGASIQIIVRRGLQPRQTGKIFYKSGWRGKSLVMLGRCTTV